jgi:hypothetical protein
MNLPFPAYKLTTMPMPILTGWVVRAALQQQLPDANNSTSRSMMSLLCLKRLRLQLAQFDWGSSKNNSSWAHCSSYYIATMSTAITRRNSKTHDAKLLRSNAKGTA